MRNSCDCDLRTLNDWKTMSLFTLTICCLLSFAFLTDDCVACQDNAIDSLSAYLQQDGNDISGVVDQSFSSLPLAKAESTEAQKILVDAWKESIAKERKAELKGDELKIDDFKMKFFQRKFGDKPESGWSLYISMHGGGGAPARVNNQQWQNQKRLCSCCDEPTGLPELSQSSFRSDSP